MTKTSAVSPAPGDEPTPSTGVATTDASEPAAVAPVKRSLSTPAIVGIAVGGVLLAGVLFGGGVAVGIMLPVGGHSAGGHSAGGHSVGGHSIADNRDGMPGNMPGEDRPRGSEQGAEPEQG